MKYYILEVGSDMEVMATLLGLYIKAKQGQYIMYEVSEPKYLSVEEVTDKEFMNHHVIASQQYFDN